MRTPTQASIARSRVGALILIAALAAAATGQEPSAESSNDSQPSSTATTDTEPPSSATGLLNLNIEQLSKVDVVVPSLDTVVNSVSRQESTVGRSPTAVFVITQEMIRRSGATCIPEALRMAPGLDVAKINSDTWAISARGFNSRFANKLLVMIDRRVVYNTTFGGVYWDMQDVVIQDVDRIEVIRGPGTVAWGSNAVNGVISVYTKRAKDTQGALASTGGGSYEQDFQSVRYGDKAGENIQWRGYVKRFDRNHGFDPVGTATDTWSQARAGFRSEWTPTREDLITFQGDVFSGYSGSSNLLYSPTPPLVSLVTPRTDLQGGNLLLRWQRQIDEDTASQFQGYYDNYSKVDQVFSELRNTCDFDYQYTFSPLDRHKWLCGANYRNSADVTGGNFSFSLAPASYTVQWASIFAQDEIELIDERLFFTAGVRVEYNTFGKVQPEPSFRLLFQPTPQQSVWAAVSRAVRNPTRVETALQANVLVAPIPPTFLHLMGNQAIGPESLMAYEIGYRIQATERFSYDIAVFYNDYLSVFGYAATGTSVSGGDIFLNSQAGSNLAASSYGFELSSTLKMSDRWKVLGAYSSLNVNAFGSDSLNTAYLISGTSPSNQVYVRSSWDVRKDVDFDLTGRYVDRLVAIDVPSYITMDTRLAWRVRPTLEASIVGQNLLQPHHLEFVDIVAGMIPTEVPRGVYGMMTWTR